VCFASTTITLFFAIIIVLLPPAPPRPTQTSGFNIFMVSFGAGCCAHADTAKILPANRAIAEPKTLFFVIRIFPFEYRTLLPGLCTTQIRKLELKGCTWESRSTNSGVRPSTSDVALAFRSDQRLCGTERRRVFAGRVRRMGASPSQSLKSI